MRFAGLLLLFAPGVFSAPPAAPPDSPVLEILIEAIGPQLAGTLGPAPKVEAAAKLVPETKRPAVLAALKGLEKQSSSTTTLRELMDTSLILGQASQALSSADKLREVAPGPESETTRAWALSQTGDFPGAFTAAQELDKLHPGREDVRALLAYTRERVKAGGGGGPSAFMSKELDINDGAVLAGPGRAPSEVRPVAMALMKRAVAVRREGDPEGTLTLAREALRADPTAPVVQEFYRMAVADHAKWRWEDPRVLADYAKATQAKQEGRWEAAIAHMEAAANKQPHPNVLKALEKLKADAAMAKQARKAPEPGSGDFPVWPLAGFGLGAAGFAVLKSRGSRPSDGERWPEPGRWQEFVAGAVIAGTVGAVLVVTGRAAAPLAMPVLAKITERLPPTLASQVGFLRVANDPKIIRWGPTTGQGPLSPRDIATFRGGTYTESALSEPIELYRYYGGSAEKLGRFWTRQAPTGPLQSRLDGAVMPEWNNMSNLVKIRVPAGQTIYEGYAASQGGLVGGGNQILIPAVSPDWVVK